MRINTLHKDPTHIWLYDDQEATLIRLAHLHGLSEKQMEKIGLHNVSVFGIWETIRVWILLENHNNVDGFQAWFNRWYEVTIADNDFDVAVTRLLAFPYQVFNHDNFLRATKYIAYNNVGHVEELTWPNPLWSRMSNDSPNGFVRRCI